MKLSDIVEARAKWVKAHGKLPKRMLVPPSLMVELHEAILESQIGAGDRIYGMTVETSPFKSDALDFA